MNKKSAELIAKYNQQKMDFLDSLQPDDFRNASSFNQAEIIIDELVKVAITKQNPREFMAKAAENLFRENSAAAKKAIDLVGIYFEIGLKN